MRRLLLVWTAALAGSPAGCQGASPNESPVAVLAVPPEPAAPGARVTLDASGSHDPDGFVIAYRWELDDGSPVTATAAATLYHVFAAPGRYEIAVTVIDDRGAESTARATVRVLDGPSECPAPLERCGDACVDTTSDSGHCGGCDRPCEDGECVAGVCEGGGCPPDAPLACPDGACVDPLTDPLNCGDCGNVCLTGVCLMGACEVLPPGTVLDVFPPPPFPTTRGLTHVEGDWYLLTGRRFVHFDPLTGENLGDWWIQNEASRRAYGLAGLTAPTGVVLLATGSHNRFGNPLSNVRLDFYLPFGEIVGSAEQLGGPMATDGKTLWVFYNETKQLIEIDVEMGQVTSVTPIAGLAPTDWFTDLALDGYGGLWAVRPDVMGPLGPLMCKLSIAAASLESCVPPPTPDGLGGVVLHEGALWGVGEAGTFRMVP